MEENQKMKSGSQKLKKFLAFVMTVVMVLTAVPLGGLTFSASAENEGYYTYTVENGEATITDCDESISGEVVIPNKLGGYPVTSIGQWAFSYCNGLTSITIPDSVTFIGSCAFSYCTGLTSINIPDGVTSICESAFTWCESLTSITIPDGVTSIDDCVFSGCTNLTSVTIQNSVTSIGEWAFCACTGLTSVSIGNSVTSIGDYAFCGCTGLKSITIPDSVTSIGGGAFKDCTGLTSVTIGNSVTSIGEEAFYGCTGLTSITIPDSVTSIGENTFACTGLTNVSIGNNVKYIGDQAFSWCKITSITIPDGVTCIGDYAFCGCTGLKSITIPDSVTSIGGGAFKDCTGLTSVTIGNSVTSIGEEAFYGCTGLTSITIPDSVTSIGSGAFGACIGLTSITIPDSVTSIGDDAFYWCTGLTSITVSAGNTVYHSTDNCLIETESKKLILGCKNSIIPSEGSVTSIGDQAFAWCEITSITIPDSVMSIGDWAFSDCTGLTSITIPDSVTSIGDYAFYYCVNLTSVTISATVTDIGDRAFGYYHDNVMANQCKVKNFTIYGYAGTAAETYANENGFAFISHDNGHVFSEWVVTTEPTCTAEGEETRTCSVCGATETRPVEKKAHDLFHVEEASTCTVAGVSYDVCDSCGNTFNYTVLPLAAHTFGDWVTTKEATVFESGERKRTCTVCGFEETEEIERLNVAEVKDEKTGISVVYPENSYEGEVEISVTQTFDGASYHVLNAEKGNYQKALFDITTLIDGNKVQPNGSVFVKIPLPDGYSAEKTVVYYITNDGRLEKMDSRVEDGYIIFETTHFSFYAIVDETEKQPENPSENCSCACHKKGIAKLFFKIKLFFQKIFKKNKVCKCGVNHY